MITVEQAVRVFKTQDGEVAALDGVDLQVEKGEFFVLLGPSGSGKTTLLRCVAGLETPDAGEIHLGSRLVFSAKQRIVVPPEQRRIGMVFQSYAIWPHMTVFENIALPLMEGKMKIPKAAVKDRVHWALSLVGLEGLDTRPAPLLSGGQQQRVALARALAVEPDVLLMDEPLSNLDARLREEVRSELKALVKQVGVTVLYVTHDQDEAMDLADRTAVMHLGKILQVGSAEELYTLPGEPRVAQFFGAMNWVHGKLEGHGVAQTPIGPVRVDGADSLGAGTAVMLGIRPEDVELLPLSEAAQENSFLGQVVSQTFAGDHRTYTVMVGDQRLVVHRASLEMLEGQVRVRIPRDKVRCFPEGDDGPPAAQATVT